MNEPTLDADGYPTEETLQAIREWPVGRQEDVDALWVFVEQAWRYDWNERTDDYVYIATGGWSGNEDIIGALKANTMFWLLHWEMSLCGGGYLFRSRRNGILDLQWTATPMGSVK